MSAGCLRASQPGDFDQPDYVGPGKKNLIKILYVKVIFNLRPVVTGHLPMTGARNSADRSLKAST